MNITVKEFMDHKSKFPKTLITNRLSEYITDEQNLGNWIYSLTGTIYRRFKSERKKKNRSLSL